MITGIKYDIIMKKRSFLLAAASVLMLVSAGCSENIFEPETEKIGTQQLSVVLTTPDGNQKTKVSLTEDETDLTNVWKAQWNKGDALGAWWSYQSAFTEFSMNSFTDNDGKIATFSGTGPAAGTLRFLYPLCDGTIVSDKYTIDLSVQSLDYNAGFSSLGKYDYILSDAVTVSETPYETSVSLKMRHLVAMLRMRLKFSNIPASGNPKFVRIEVLNGDGSTSALVPISAPLNLSDGTFDEASHGEVQVNILNGPAIAAGEIYSVQAAMLPFSVASAQTLKIRVYTVDDSGVINYYDAEVTNGTGAAFSIAAGEHSIIQKTVDLTTAAGTLSSWLGSGESEDDPYRIYTKADFVALASAVNGGASQSGKHFLLMNDIDLEGDAESQWTPVGTTSNSFCGCFDGGNHRISGLYISNSSNIQGLFGYITSGVVIKNLLLSGSVSAGKNVGLLVGYVSSSSDNPTLIYNCHTSGSLVGTGASSESNGEGGLVGFQKNYAVINGCTNRASVTAVYRVGGIAGSSDDQSVIINCANYGAVTATGTSLSYVGGITGNAADNSIGCKVINCVNFGSVTSSSTNSGFWGSIVGNIYGGGGYARNCYNTGTVTSTTGNVGKVISALQGGTISNCYYLSTAGGTAQDNAISLTDAILKGTGTIGSGTYSEYAFLAALNAEAATLNSGNLSATDYKACAWVATSTYPVPNVDLSPVASAPTDSWADVASVNFGGGSGTSSNPYLITSSFELAHLAALVRGGASQAGVYFRLTANVDLSGRMWVPIGRVSESNNFAGIFDGGGHTVSGLYYYDTNGYAGLFGCSSSAAVIKNVRVEGSLTATLKSVSGTNVAGICGMNRGKIINCSFAGDAMSYSNTGGIVGYNIGGSVINCYNEGKIVTTGTSINTCGGIIGYSTDGYIKNSYNAGLVIIPSGSSGGAISFVGYATTVFTCYYLAGSCLKEGRVWRGLNHIEDTAGTVESKTDSAMLSSTFLDLLNTNAAALRASGENDIADWKAGKAYPELALAD